MKFLNRTFLFIVTTILLVGCQQNEGMSTKENGLKADETILTTSETQKGDFIYRISSEQGQYQEGEPIVINAELEYVGDLAQIDISHAASPFYFSMKEATRNYDIPYAMNQPLIVTTLVKGDPLKTTFPGSGGYSEEDSADYKNFMKQMMSGDFLEGFYIVNGSAQFDIVETNEPITINATITFEVQK